MKCKKCGNENIIKETQMCIECMSDIDLGHKLEEIKLKYYIGV